MYGFAQFLVSQKKEFEHLTHCLKSLEADRYYMKQAIDNFREGNGETRLLQEIALQLSGLRNMEQNEWQLIHFLPQTLRFQVPNLLSRTTRSVRIFRYNLCGLCY